MKISIIYSALWKQLENERARSSKKKLIFPSNFFLFLVFFFGHIFNSERLSCKTHIIVDLIVRVFVRLQLYTYVKCHLILFILWYLIFGDTFLQGKLFFFLFIVLIIIILSLFVFALFYFNSFCFLFCFFFSFINPLSWNANQTEKESRKKKKHKNPYALLPFVFGSDYASSFT